MSDTALQDFMTHKPDDVADKDWEDLWEWSGYMTDCVMNKRVEPIPFLQWQEIKNEELSRGQG